MISFLFDDKYNVNVYFRMRISQALFERLKERFELDGSELQGKIASWMESGKELKGLIRGLKSAIETLKKAGKVKDAIGNIRSAGSMRDKLELVGILNKSGAISSFHMGELSVLH